MVEQGEPGQVLVRLQVQLEVGLHNKVLFTMHINIDRYVNLIFALQKLGHGVCMQTQIDI